MGEKLTMRGRLMKLEGRKVWLELSLSAQETICAKGEILAIAVQGH